MGNENQIVAVAGATGRTGKLIVKELSARGYGVRALVRSASTDSLWQQQGIELAEADLSSVESLERALQGAAFLISAIGSRKPFSAKENNAVDNMGNQNLAKAALKKGLQHMVVISSIGAGNSRYAINVIFRLLMTPVLRMKEKSEAFVRGCGISYTIIRPGGLSDRELTGRVAFGEGGKISGMVSRQEIARVCVDALSNPAMKNRTLEVIDASTLKEEQRPFTVDLHQTV
jgi:uncharacterized protein YbjT (DUF2867 family)